MNRIAEVQGGQFFTNVEAFEKFLMLPPCKQEGCQAVTDLRDGRKYAGRAWDAGKQFIEGAYPDERKGLCHLCAYWLEMERADAKRTSGVVVQREYSTSEGVKVERWHYSYDEDEPMVSTQRRQMLGHGGAHWNIEYYDGRKVETNNLWCQSTIPEWFLDRFPVNAKFV